MYFTASQLPYRLGRYEIQAEIGRGAYAVVYRARLTGPMGFQKKVALKLARSPLTEGQEEDEGRIKALVNEARVGGRLQHPNIVEIYEFGRIEGFYFIAMEFVEGLTVGQVLDVLKTRGRAVPPGVAIEIIAQTCQGLSYAHDLADEAGERHSVVHRDLKPANLMIARTGLLKVMDFGIAKSAFALFHTAEGMTKGTPMYMSPEQVYGRKVTPGSDIFAVGSILFEMVTGEPLFIGESVVEIIEKVAEEDSTPRLNSRKDRLGAMIPVLQKCLAKDPRKRYHSALDLLVDVEKLRATFPMTQSVLGLLLEVEGIRQQQAPARSAPAPRPAPSAPPPPPPSPPQAQVPASAPPRAAAPPPPPVPQRTAPSEPPPSARPPAPPRPAAPPAPPRAAAVPTPRQGAAPPLRPGAAPPPGPGAVSQNSFLPEADQSIEIEANPDSSSSTIEILPGDLEPLPPAPSPSRAAPPAPPRPTGPVGLPPRATPAPTDASSPPGAERRRPKLGSWSVVLPAMGPDFVGKAAAPAPSPAPVAPPSRARPSAPPEEAMGSVSLELAALPPLKGRRTGSDPA